MTLFDGILVAVAGFFSLRSLLRGATRELFSLVGLLLAGILASRYYALCVPLLEPWLPYRWERLAAALLGLFFGVYLSMFLAGLLLSRLIKAIKLGLFDRGAGLVVGAAKAYIVSCCLIILLLQFQPGSAIVKRSRLAPYCLPGISLLSDSLAPALAAALQKHRHP